MKSVFRKKQMDHEMSDELEFHQSMLRDRLLREGVPQPEVDAATRRAFGNAGRWQERLSELWQFRRLENFFRDVSFSVRLLRKSLGFTAVAVLTLALGVGANTAVFSMINALLLRPLPVPHAEQLAVLSYVEGTGDPQYDFCTPYFRALENQHQIFANVFAYDPDAMLVQGQTSNENVPGQLVSGQYFDALQVAPLLGRVLTPADDVRGGNATGWAVVISEGFWQRWFDRAPDVIGKQLVIANVPFTVVGVMPKQFVGADPTLRPEIFAPLSADPVIAAPQNHLDEGMHAWWIMLGARRQPGVTLEQANVALQTLSMPILLATADADHIAEGQREHFRFAAEAGSKGFTYARLQFSKPLVAMGWMCGGVLLLACLNLAGLLLARSAARERELATRMAMGGSRRRLIQQLLVESMLIAVAGTAMGLAVSPLVSRSLAAVLMSGNKLSGDTLFLDTSLDVRVFGFAALIAIVSTVLIGLLPALRATGANLSGQIKNGQYTAKTQRRGLLPRVLLASEVALALVLVIGAGLLAASLVRLFASGVGFDPKGLVNLNFKMDTQPLKDDALMRVYQQIGEGLRPQPGVTGVSFESIVPISGLAWNGGFTPPGGKSQMLMLNSVAPDYFSTMRIPMRAGREFRWNDTKTSGMKIILNEKAAEAIFPGRSAIGQQVTRGYDKASFEVVAIVADAKYRSVRSPAPPTGYIPIQQDNARSLHAVVRLEDAPGAVTALSSAARAVTARLAPTVPPPTLTTVNETMNRSVSAERLMAMLSVFFAVCALLVTAIGLYGTLAYATARRTSEIGIRMALGARRECMMAMIFRENIVIAAVGCGAGLIVAMLASKALASFLYGTSAHDPRVLVGSVAALIVIASMASLLPALRAARIEPVVAIRYE